MEKIRVRITMIDELLGTASQSDVWYCIAAA